MYREEIITILSEFGLFREMSRQEIAKIADISISREWKKHSHIFMQGDPLDNVYFINAGKIKIYKSDINGKEQIVAILKKGEMFPHVGFFRKGDYPAYAEALEKSILVVVPITQFEKVLIENPELSIKVFRVLGEKIVDLQNRLEEQILNNTYEQIVKLLVRLGENHGQERSDGTILLKGEFTNKDLANMIGTTRETVSRTLTKMKKDGLIEVDRHGDFILAPDKLLEEFF
ncbi:Crp/Fnr family transcriptional regulator [Bacillus canaveralius]|uniref:Crp/Fnr family transcriptional regulator n=1 Tax=Bacillus canaveralius TaxID=1403243 RepID=A0A2N5GHW7_9BACI|nr:MULTISPECIES: Crp/Fnr family transcriptional regulator [Bacillus]PLR80444.1 Crp/Fnr family transcriptional regulator [Bacillus canaveralius]PLR82690.1 Crp/Fnr family transcriptional regulator [Bacillus sp. V33-4]PLS00691.1 Crp/Fnr family transcriptional regulator [Bacillus canaveralius]